MQAMVLIQKIDVAMRYAGLGACLAIMAGCATAVASDTQPVLVTDKTLRQCLDRLGAESSARNVPPKVFRQYTRSLRADPDVIEKLNFQPEFISSVSRYLKSAVSEQRIKTGRELLSRHRKVLDKLEAHYGIPKEYLVAVWGIESNYGKNFGSRPVLQSLATLACHGRRQTFFRNELFATLKILNAGHIQADKLVGSWAGAFGHTQFMPTTFLSRAVDHDGDGRRDLLGNLGDALASTANYLKKSGWQQSLPWGVEVNAPADLNVNSDTRKKRRALRAWLNDGVRAVRADGKRLLDTLPTSTPAALIRPADNAGPVIMVFKNFDAIHEYSLAVATLGDRIAGRPAFSKPWPDAGKPLTRSERRELQQLLLARGHRIGKVDGILGARSRAAIRKERGRLANPNSAGYRPVLQLLRQGKG